MAKVGLNNFRYGILTEGADGTPSYNGAHKPAKAISCNVSITNNSAKLFADDGLAESDTSFQSGTVTVGFDDDNDPVMADMLGHAISQSGEMIRNANDSAPYIGFGRISNAIHSASVMNDQLTTIKDGRLIHFPINYYAFDSDESNKEDKNSVFYHDKFLSDISNLSEQELKQYFEMPNNPCNFKFKACHINSFDFFAVINFAA